MDYNLIDKLNKAYQDMLYGLDLLYIIQCALDYCKGLDLGSEAASSVCVAWERLDQASKEIFLCIDFLQTEFEQKAKSEKETDRAIAEAEAEFANSGQLHDARETMDALRRKHFGEGSGLPFTSHPAGV